MISDCTGTLVCVIVGLYEDYCVNKYDLPGWKYAPGTSAYLIKLAMY